jgi:hypothetical protein
MGTAKSSVSHTFNSNGHCGDDLARRSTPIRIARDLLGRDCNTHGHAINSRRDSFNFCRTHRRDCAWCSGRSVPGKLFHRKSCGLRSCGICAGTFLRRISHGKKRLPLCEYHFRHHRAYPSFNRLESSLPWRLPRCGPSTNPRRRRKAPSNWAVVAGVSPEIPRFCSRHGCPYRRFVTRCG